MFKFRKTQAPKQSFFKGEVNVTYMAMVEKLGDPIHVDYCDKKVDVEWHICNPDDPTQRISIWNYKNGPGYGHDLKDIASFSAYHSQGAESYFEEFRKYVGHQEIDKWWLPR